MVIVTSGMARGRVRLATTTTMLPQHGGHRIGHSHLGYLEGLNRKEALFFARFSRLAAATQPTASSLQQSTMFC